MSNETRIKGKSYTGIELESTYGVAPSPDVTFPSDAIPTFGFDVQRKITDLPREIDSPLDASVAGVAGMEEVSFGFDAELTGLNVDDSASAPVIVDLLRGLGFAAPAGYDAGPPKSIYMELASNAAASFSMIHRQEDIVSGQGEAWTLRGCRADGTLKLARNAKVLIGVSGRARTGVRAAYSAAIPALAYEDTEGQTRFPLVTKGITSLLESVDGTITYGGCFIEAEIAFNRGMTATECSDSPSGVGEILLIARQPITGTILVKDVPVADFNAWAQQSTQKDMKITLTYVPQDGSTEAVEIQWYFRVTGVEEAEDNGQHALQISFAGLYPSPSRSDAAPAGVTPANNLRITWYGASA